MKTPEQIAHDYVFSSTSETSIEGIARLIRADRLALLEEIMNRAQASKAAPRMDAPNTGERYPSMDTAVRANVQIMMAELRGQEKP